VSIVGVYFYIENVKQVLEKIEQNIVFLLEANRTIMPKTVAHNWSQIQHNSSSKPSFYITLVWKTSCHCKWISSNTLVCWPIKTSETHLHWPFLKQDWKGKARKYREDLDTGALEELKCPTCQKGFKRNKDYNITWKIVRNVNVTYLDVGKHLTTWRS